MLHELVDSLLHNATYIHKIQDLCEVTCRGCRPLSDPPLGLVVLFYCREDAL